MDPLSAALAGTACFSFAKDVFELGRDTRILCKHIKDAPQILKDFVAELQLLDELLQQLCKPAVLARNDAFVLNTINNLRTKVSKLRKPIQKLKSRCGKPGFRLSVALEVDGIKSCLKDIEGAKSLAHSALTLLNHASLTERIDLLLAKLSDITQHPSRGSDSVGATLDSLASAARVFEPPTLTLCTKSDQTSTISSDLQTRRILAWVTYLIWQRWHFAIQHSYGLWTYTFRVHQIVPKGAEICTAIKHGDVRQARMLFETGRAHPSDYIEGSDNRSLLALAVKPSRHSVALINLLFDMSNISHDTRMITEALAVTDRYLVDSSVYKLLIERSNVDLLTDWYSCGTSAHDDTSFRIPRFVEHGMWLTSRQYALTNGSHFKPATDLLKVAPWHDFQNGWISLSQYMVSYGIVQTADGLRKLDVSIKEWLLHTVIWKRSFDCCHGDEVFPAEIPPLLRAGATLSSIVHGFTATAALLTSGASSRASLVRLADRFKVWLKFLALQGIDVAAYLTHDMQVSAAASLGPVAAHGEQPVQGYRVKADSYRYDLTAKTLSVQWDLQWSLSVWVGNEKMPGAWPLHPYSPNYSMVDCSCDEGNSWKRYPQPTRPYIRLSLDQDELLKHLGVESAIQLSVTQDDHGYVARSVLRPAFTGPSRRRACSQPRSIQCKTWRNTTHREPRWLAKTHRCPFHPHHYLHEISSSCQDAPPYEELATCLTGTRPRHDRWASNDGDVLNYWRIGLCSYKRTQSWVPGHRHAKYREGVESWDVSRG